ncbi:MAG: FapA family protein [Spirochaetia bacterium]|nr:FapA family protein [Spirochaetia bacterium]
MAHEKIHITVEKDNMTARLRIRGAYDPSVTVTAVREALNEMGISYGVDPEAIEKAIDSYHATQKMDDSAVIVKGYRGKETIDGKIEMLIEESKHVSIDESGKADFRNIKNFITVQKGQALARHHLPVMGEPGMSIYGDQVQQKEPRNPRLDSGINVSIVKKGGFNEYISDAKGIVSHNNKIIEVNPVLKIAGDVGIESGNIKYDGDVEISGSVERGSSVIASGSISVGGMIESGNVKLGGVLNVKGGINTKSEGRLLIKGELISVYIDNSKIFVNGDVTVDRSITISNIITHGGILLNDQHSTISGGEILSYDSITADIIGSKAEIPTVITIGTHYERNKQVVEISRELDETKREFERLTDEMQKMKLFIQRMRNKITEEKREEFRLKIQEYTQTKQLGEKLEKDLKELRMTRFNPAEVTITARNIIYPGVQIHYRGNVEKITAPLTKCVIRFRAGQEKPEITAFTE